MVEVEKRIRVHKDGRVFEALALFDTGTTTLITPKSVADELGAEVLREIDVELADGTVKR